MQQLAHILLVSTVLSMPTDRSLPYDKFGILFAVKMKPVIGIRCFTDNQGIPVEEAPYIIARFKVSWT